MALFILGIIISAITFFAFGFCQYKTEPKTVYWKVNKKQVIAIVGIVFMVLSCFTTISTGHTGIVTTFGKVEDSTYEAGMHVKLPWQEIIEMDNRNQKKSVEMSCFSSDIQEVEVMYSLNYQISKDNAQTIYKTIGTEYYDTVIMPRVQEAVKTIFARYTAENLVANREILSTEIKDILDEKLQVYNIEILDASVENIDFTDAFTTAVEEKQVAAQNKLKAETEQARLTMEEQASAERSIIEANAKAQTAIIAAEADLEIVKIQADAAEYAGQKDAAVNEAIAKSLTPELLYYYYITNWDGKLPGTYISEKDFNALFNVDANAPIVSDD